MDDTKWSSDYMLGAEQLFEGMPHSRGSFLQKLNGIQQNKNKGLHLGENKLVQASSFGKNWPESSFEKEDLRALVDNLSMDQHHALVTMRPSCVQSCICKGLVRNLIYSPLFGTFNTTSGYCVQLWASQCKGDIEKLDWVQQRPPRWLGSWGMW